MKKIILGIFTVLFAASIIVAGTTTNFTWDYGTKGQYPWWDVWTTILQAIDTEVYQLKLRVLGFDDARRYASINAAVTAIGSTETTLVVSNDQTLTANLNTPSTLTLKIVKGGKIIKASTYSVTINGPFEAGLYQVFSGFDAGDVTFGQGVCESVKGEWFGITGTADDIAINKAIRSVRTSKIPVKLIAKTYTLADPITIGAEAQYNGFKMFGAGDRSTILSIPGSTKDVIQVGAIDHDYAYDIILEDFGTSGGRYAINLNGVAGVDINRVELSNAVVGLYTQGSAEFVTGRHIHISNSSQNGMLFGQLNGGTAGLGLNYPLLQKAKFDHCRVHGTTGGSAIKISAGNLGGQQTSLMNVFDHVLLESNYKDEIEIEQSDKTTFRQISNEGLIDADNTYTILKMGTGASNIFVYDSVFTGIDGIATNNYKYGIDTGGGHVYVYNCLFSYSQTADIYVQGALTLVNSHIQDATKISFVDQTARNKSILINVHNSSGTPISVGATSLYSTGGLYYGGLRFPSLEAGTFYSPIITLTADTGSPSVTGGGTVFLSADTVANNWINFASEVAGQQIKVIFANANTTVIFDGYNFKGNGGVNWTAAQYDWMDCVFDGTYWYCSIHESS